MKLKADIHELIDIWWKTAEIMDAMPATASQELKNWHAYVFEKILIQCGWSVTEWNNTVLPKQESEV